ncbi:ABC transporter substrate-binding protein [Microbacterium sp.]|uniref:ABC transporter substrate-binding protein n=1 Tax=Microbacterium sp. TaxID=51671 RepID=UPI003A84FC1A
MTRRTHAAAGFALAAVTALTLTACGSASDPSTSAEADGSLELYGHTFTQNDELRDLLPQDVLDKGTLVFSSDGAAPPRTFVDDNGDLVGFVPDLIAGMGALFGVEVDIQKNSFDAEVPGVESGKFDSTTGTGDFPTRRDVLDMVDYSKAGQLFLVAAGNPKNVTNDQLSQCGLRVGVLKGTTQEQLVTDLSARCEEEGKPAIDLQSFNNVLLPVPLEADRVDVVWETVSTGFMVVAEQPDVFAVAGDPIYRAYLAFGVSKERTELRDAFQAALQSMIDDGSYQAILDEWDQGDLAIDYISINSDLRD